ncbi:unnamed protein product [Effrenium voratum]|nr:unnamed protein product [Effrenium voratum]
MERQPRRLAAHPSQPEMLYYGPSGQCAQPLHFGPPAQFAQPWHSAAPSGQFAQPVQFAQQPVQSAQRYTLHSHPTAEPGQTRALDPTYCLLDERGNPKPFSSVSQVSGRNYEGMISSIFYSSGPRTLRAVQNQEAQERNRLETCKAAVADFLRTTVSDHVGDAMTKTGVGEQQAEVDTVYNGSFRNFAEQIKELCTVKVSATCDEVERVLVEACSDSRFVAMKLFQIEIQSGLVGRNGFLDYRLCDRFQPSSIARPDRKSGSTP